MCTPDNMPPMCSCPHEGAAVPRAFLAVAVLAGGVALAVAAGYGLWVFLGGWLLLMGAAALVSLGRDRRRARERRVVTRGVQLGYVPAATVPTPRAQRTAEWQEQQQQR